MTETVPEKVFTWQARIDPGAAHESFLADYADLYQAIKRKLFADASRDKKLNALATYKNAYLKRYAITARQFNALRIELQGQIESIKALRKDHLSAKQNSLTKASEEIEKFNRRIDVLVRTYGSPEQISKLKFKREGKRRRQDRLTRIIAQLTADIEQGTLRLCFGSRKLFRAQFSLQENGYKAHAEWAADWRKARSDSFYVLGSKDETAGNQGCTINIDEHGYRLRLRLPEGIDNDSQRHIDLNLPALKYGNEGLLEAVAENTLRSLQKRKAWQVDNPDQQDAFKARGVAISYRFKRDPKGWRVFITSTLRKALKADLAPGAIGVDLNENGLSVTETDAQGNFIHAFNVSCCTYGKSQAQSEAIIGDACRRVTTYAAQQHKQLVSEKLDFSKKKQELKNGGNPRYARMLSSFNYNQIKQTLKSQCFRLGLPIKEVNPAFTSVIGQAKYAARYGLSVDLAAALCIARRGLGFRESYRVHLRPITRSGYELIVVAPARKSQREWTCWSAYRKSLMAACRSFSVSHRLNKRAQIKLSPVCPTEIVEVRPLKQVV